ncbi:MAG: imidazoleglycerol-phosphate dehydratase HisB [Oscillospiraceae bacterium]|jgi:imidazoleglycerol-phosphate dehydratase|nr:imidazoleglycerol-phosphate dehydratase HisB [Oscillospiraceae bacterium]
MKRTAEITRKTKETDILVKLDIDGAGDCEINTGVGFFDHMLTCFAVHSGFDLTVKCQGDLQVDAHHTVEDAGIVLGTAFKQALGDIKITRFGNACIPMDDALGSCSLDICGRPFLVYEIEFENEKTGEYENCLTKEFMRAFAFNAGITLHICAMYGSNDHHKTEALFKSLAYALKQAVRIKEDGRIVSSKGVLS